METESNKGDSCRVIACFELRTIIIEIHESAFREIILMIHYYLLEELINSDDSVTAY